MTSLQLGLIFAGVALVIGVVVYNWWQERRLRADMDEAVRPAGGADEGKRASPSASPTRASERVEPTLAKRSSGDQPMLTRAGAAAPQTRISIDDIDDGEASDLPIRVQARISEDAAPPSTHSASAGQESLRAAAPPAALTSPSSAFSSTLPSSASDTPPSPPSGPASAPAASPPAAQRVVHADAHGAQPDPDIECVIALQCAKPVAVGALAAGLHARPGKRLRWFGRRGASMPWQLLRPDITGEFSNIVACLLLADRTGAASAPLLESFVKLVADVAPALPATFVAPEVPRESARAATLDRICADLDVQIGLTVLKASPATITGTRLRGVAEAAGFRLAGGRFEWVQEESGAVLYALQNFRAEPFTADSLRASATPGAVFLLDVPRVADPVRVFDHMKLAAKRMAQTLDAALVDDNRRALDNAALASIRLQVQQAVSGLHAVHIEPGSPRALALFGG